MIDALSEVAGGAVGGIAKAVPAAAETAASGIAKATSAAGEAAVGSVAARSLADTMGTALATSGSGSAFGKLLEAKPEGTSGQGLSNEPSPIPKPNTVTPEGLQSNDNTASILSSEDGAKAETADGRVPAEGKVPAGETPQETIPLEQELRELTLEQRIGRIEELLDGERERGEGVGKNVEELLKKLEELKKEEQARRRENEELARQNAEMAERIKALEEQQKKLLETIADVDDTHKVKIVQIAEAKRIESQRLRESLNRQQRAA